MTTEDTDVEFNSQLKDIRVIDGDRVLQFMGVRIGASSSHQPGKTRWAEIYIYRTEAGTYIVSGIGRSKIDGESDKCWAYVEENPADVIKRLHMTADGGGKYIPYVSRDAIAQARTVDAVFAAAYMVEHVD